MNKLQQSSSLIWEVCSLLPVPAEPSRGGSPLTQLACGSQMGPEELRLQPYILKKDPWSSSNKCSALEKHSLPFILLQCINQQDTSSRRFIYQVFPTTPEQSHAQTEISLLYKYKQSSRVFVSNLVSQHISHNQQKSLFVVRCSICMLEDPVVAHHHFLMTEENL